MQSSQTVEQLQGSAEGPWSEHDWWQVRMKLLQTSWQLSRTRACAVTLVCVAVAVPSPWQQGHSQRR
jgi:hypothetical protein